MNQIEQIFGQIEQILKLISNEIKYADLGYSSNTNSSGDNQLKLDVLSDKIIEQEFSKLSCVKALISEEKNEILTLNDNAKYIIAYDPLDGSSLIDVNFAVGSIFAIYENEILPKNLVAAAYGVYGPRLEFVISKKNEYPKLYRLNKDENFVFIKELTLKDQGKINATGGTQKCWSPTHIKFVCELFLQGYRLRYSGAMVSDLHQILLKGGGIFSYPATSDALNGKLRLLFEVLPFAFIFKNAKGEAVNDKLKSLFDIDITSLHQTSPCFFGSKYEIEFLTKIYKSENE